MRTGVDCENERDTGVDCGNERERAGLVGTRTRTGKAGGNERERACLRGTNENGRGCGGTNENERGCGGTIGFVTGKEQNSYWWSRRRADVVVKELNGCVTQIEKMCECLVVEVWLWIGWNRRTI